MEGSNRDIESRKIRHAVNRCIQNLETNGKDASKADAL